MVEENKYYHFRVLKGIMLPDDTHHWVLTLDGHDRYTLPESYYSGYGIKAGDTLHCRVDKINCNGKIFLEPEHPFYKEGAEYVFRFVTAEDFRDAAGNILRRLTLEGEHGDLHFHMESSLRFSFQEGEPVNATIQLIRKGRLLLKIKDLSEGVCLEPGGLYAFDIEDDKDPDHWNIRGPGNIRSVLRKAWYHQYPLETGKTFRGFFIKWKIDGMPVIEPEHPYYQPGIEYLFPISDAEEVNAFGERSSFSLHVTDCFGNRIKVFIRDGGDQRARLNESLRCYVIRLKEGKPVLRPV